MTDAASIEIGSSAQELTSGLKLYKSVNRWDYSDVFGETYHMRACERKGE